MTSEEHSRDATAGSASGPVTAEVLDGWRSELAEFFSEVRTRLNRLAEGEKGDGGNIEFVGGESPPVTSFGPPEATAREEADRSPPESPGLDGSLERLQEIKRQLAARLGKS